MEKEKFSIIKVTIVSILITLIIAFSFLLFLGHLNSNCTRKDPNITSQEAQAQNIQFEVYFGNHVSANDVKQLLSLVKTNNSDNDSQDRVEKTVYINSQDSIDSSCIEGGIQSGKYYTVEVINDKKVAPGVSIQDNNAGYYENKFIRNISIKLYSNNKPDHTIQPNTTNVNNINKLTLNIV